MILVPHGGAIIVMYSAKKAVVCAPGQCVLCVPRVRTMDRERGAWNQSRGLPAGERDYCKIGYKRENISKVVKIDRL